MIKPLIKKVLARYYPICKYLWINPFPSEKFIFQSCINKHLKKDFFFIQIGANDGVSFDPIHDLIKKHNWQGILVEPLPDYMESLKKTYENQTGLFYEQSAITSDKSFSHIFRIAPAAIKQGLLPQWAQGVSSLHPDRNVLGKMNGGANIDDALYELIKSHTIREEINPLSFDEMVSKYDVKKVDLLQIDTEGHDFQVIKSINFDIVKPTIIHAEFYNLPQDEKDALLKLLKQQKYRILYAKKDILAERIGVKDVS